MTFFRLVRRPLARGFTLVELLVVMALLSLVMLAMGSALSTAAQTEERVDVRLARADDLRVASEFLHDILGRVAAHKNPGLQNAGDSEFLFKGGDQELQWVGVMPARHGMGGRHHFSLVREERAEGPVLVVRFVPWRDDAEPPNWAAADSLVLAGQVRGLGLSYLDNLAEPPMWVPQWTEAKRLPDRIRLAVDAGAGPWPELVVALRLLPQSDPRATSAVFGGTR